MNPATGCGIVFGKYFPTKEDAVHAYARQPKRIATRVYAPHGQSRRGQRRRLEFRGRGLIQLTGRSNYKAFAEWIGDDKVLETRTSRPANALRFLAVLFWDKTA